MVLFFLNSHRESEVERVDFYSRAVIAFAEKTLERL
jgi:hypothetical protein